MVLGLETMWDETKWKAGVDQFAIYPWRKRRGGV